MVFKRRDKPPFLSRLRHAVYPQRGWRRAIEYLGHRVRRLPDTPHRIAIGVSCGVFVSFTPLFGLHFVLAIALARLFRGNILASLIGTVFGNPVTFPFIASISLGFGRRILGYGASGRNFAKLHEAFEQFFAALWESILALFGQGTAHWGRLNVFMQDIFWPYLVGSILPGLACAVACYFLSRPIIAAYQARRRAVLLARTRAADAKRKKKAESDAAEKSAYIAPKNSATS